MSWGVDYASVDRNKLPDYKQLKVAGCEFVWLRASYGVMPDQTFARDWADLATAGFVRGAYMFPVLPLTATPERQVQVFVDAVKAHGGLRPGIDFPPCLDIEFPGHGIAATGLDRVGVMAWLRRAIAALRAVFGCWPILYTSGRVWNDHDADCLGNPPAPDLVECPLWLARYPYKTREPAVLPPPAGLLAPPVPTPWGDAWVAHQYQGDALGVPGMSSTVDVDRFRVARLGDHGGHVALAQRRMRLTADGVFGPLTERAVKVHSAAGVIDPPTFAAIAWLR